MALRAPSLRLRVRRLARERVLERVLRHGGGRLRGLRTAGAGHRGLRALAGLLLLLEPTPEAVEIGNAALAEVAELQAEAARGGAGGLRLRCGGGAGAGAGTCGRRRRRGGRLAPVKPKPKRVGVGVTGRVDRGFLRLKRDGARAGQNPLGPALSHRHSRLHEVRSRDAGWVLYRRGSAAAAGNRLGKRTRASRTGLVVVRIRVGRGAAAAASLGSSRLGKREGGQRC